MTLTDTEWIVMHVVWDASPVTARMVHSAVQQETGWAYDTVRTILNRLAKKGAVRSELQSNVAYFSPLLSRSEARNSALSWLKEKAFQGASGAFLKYLVTEEKLSEREKSELAALLDELES